MSALEPDRESGGHANGHNAELAGQGGVTGMQRRSKVHACYAEGLPYVDKLAMDLVALLAVQASLHRKASVLFYLTVLCDNLRCRAYGTFCCGVS